MRSKIKNPNELHDSRLATTDEDGHRVYLYPEDVHGVWKNRRKLIYLLLIFVYMVLPWIYFQGEPLILIDLPGREFHFFGNIFFGHDAPFLFFLMLSFVLIMGFLTARYGRIWCGFTCPQTVFIQMIFAPIERLIEGKARRRQKLDQLPLFHGEKILKKTLKWTIYTLVALHISHSFLGYFVGARDLLKISISDSPLEHPTLFLSMLILTTITLLDFGWFREQFCIIACPYGRMQSVVMDQDSQVVLYDYTRGEPRKGETMEGEADGDCVNCYACVKVCPTGIDIRRGTQLECIMCTQCIDACDDIMTRIKKPKGLIRFTSEASLEKESPKLKFRQLIYLLLLAVVMTLGGHRLVARDSVKIQLVRGKGKAFQTFVKDDQEMIRNRFTLDLYNGGRERVVEIVGLDSEVRLVIPKNLWKLKEGINKSPVFFELEKKKFKRGSYDVLIGVKENGQFISKKEVNLVGPL